MNRKELENKIFNIDCLLLMLKLEDNVIDNVITSPPYNRTKNDKYKFHNDNKKDYKKFIFNVLDELLRITKYYIFFNIQNLDSNFKICYDIMFKYKNNVKDIFIWNKTNPQPNHYDGCIINAYEYIIVLSKDYGNRKGFERHSFSQKDTISNVLNKPVNSKNKYSKIHSAVFPEWLPDFFIKNFTKINDLIFDPFGGVGTTALSCLKLHRKFLITELESEYYKIIVDRVEEEMAQGKFF